MPGQIRHAKTINIFIIIFISFLLCILIATNAPTITLTIEHIIFGNISPKNIVQK